MKSFEFVVGWGFDRQMSKGSTVEIRNADRYAFYFAYDGLCGYCKRQLDYEDFEIEHIVPRSLDADTSVWRQTLLQLGIPLDFHVESDGNRMAACRSCNSKKGTKLLLNIGIYLTAAADNMEKVAAYRAKFLANRKVQGLKANLDKALQDPDFRQEISTWFFGQVPHVATAYPGPWPNSAASEHAKQLLGKASKMLLQWPQTTENHWFPRQELNELSRAILSDTPQLSFLLGPPGSGKSALLGRLGLQLSKKGHILLALKADLLPPNISQFGN